MERGAEDGVVDPATGLPVSHFGSSDRLPNISSHDRKVCYGATSNHLVEISSLPGRRPLVAGSYHAEFGKQKSL